MHLPDVMPAGCGDNAACCHPACTSCPSYALCRRALRYTLTRQKSEKHAWHMTLQRCPCRDNRPCTVQQPAKARRPAAKHASPASADRFEDGSEDTTREDGTKLAAPGQALRSGRQRPLPAAAARQPSPSAPAAESEVEADAAGNDARRDVGRQAEHEQPPAGPRPRRPERLAGNKRSRRASSAGDEEAAPADAADAAAEGVEGQEDDGEANEDTTQAAHWPPARQLRSRRREMPASDDMSVGSRGNEEDGGAAVVTLNGTSVLAADTSRRRPRWAARKRYPASLQLSDGDDGGEDAEEPDNNEDSDDQAAHTAPAADGPKFSGRGTISPNKSITHERDLCSFCTGRHQSATATNASVTALHAAEASVPGKQTPSCCLVLAAVRRRARDTRPGRRSDSPPLRRVTAPLRASARPIANRVGKRRRQPPTKVCRRAAAAVCLQRDMLRSTVVAKHTLCNRRLSPRHGLTQACCQHCRRGHPLNNCCQVRTADAAF